MKTGRRGRPRGSGRGSGGRPRGTGRRSFGEGSEAGQRVPDRFDDVMEVERSGKDTAVPQIVKRSRRGGHRRRAGRGRLKFGREAEEGQPAPGQGEQILEMEGTGEEKPELKIKKRKKKRGRAKATNTGETRSDDIPLDMNKRGPGKLIECAAQASSSGKESTDKKMEDDGKVKKRRGRPPGSGKNQKRALQKESTLGPVSIDLLDEGDENQMEIDALPDTTDQMNEVSEEKSDEFDIIDKLRAVSEKFLFSDLLEEETDRRRRASSVRRDTAENNKQKIEQILEALDKNCQEILTLEFFKIQSLEVENMDVEVKMAMFEGGILKEIRKVFDGNLTSVREIGVNICYEMFRNDQRFDAAFFVAKVEADCAFHRRGKKEASIRKKFYGVKTMGTMSGAEFKFDFLESGIPVITEEQAVAMNLSFDLTSVKSWIKTRLQVEELAKMLKKLKKESELPFISYELSNEHAVEDWDIIEEKRQILKRLSLTEAEFEKPVRFVDKVKQKKLVISENGQCPVTHEKYKNLGEHVKRLDRLIPELHFEYKDDGTVLVSRAVAKKGFKVRGEELTEWEGPRGNGPGPIPDDEQLFPIVQEEVPYRTGKHQQFSWVRHKCPNDWVVRESIRRLRNLPDFPKDFLPMAILINTFLLKDEFKYVDKLGVRRGMLDFFEQKEKEIIATPKGDWIAINWACILHHMDVFTADDFHVVMPRYTEHLIERQKSEGIRPESD